jgi:hypothetical protein
MTKTEELQRVHIEGAGFAESDPRGTGSDSHDSVQEASEESFPASDPPAFSPASPEEESDEMAEATDAPPGDIPEHLKSGIHRRPLVP